MRRMLKPLIIVFVIFILILLYSRFIATNGLNIKEYKVVNEQITDSYHGLKVVHFSDLHYNSTIHEKELKVLVDKVNELKPDIIVYTGDLFTEKKSYDKDILINYLSKLEAKLGKYYVSGNHDTPMNDYQEIMNASGFKNMDNDYTLIYNESRQAILLSGISTCFEGNSNKNKSGMPECDMGIKTAKVDSYLADTKEEGKPIYSILLMHEPDFVDNINLNNYDLVLSGHSHGGQVRLPIIGKIYTPIGSKKYYDAHYTFNNTELYISSGIGNSGLNLRFFNHPSFNFYRITNK